MEPAPAPATAAAPFDVGDVVRRVHFAFRPEGTRFTGGHSTYAVEVDGARVRVSPVVHDLTPIPIERPGPRHVRPPTVGTAIELETTAIDRRGAGALLPGGAPTLTGEGQLVRRGTIAHEELENRGDGLEIRWRFDRAPQGEGDLVVRVRASGLAYVTETPRGLHFHDPATRLGVRYGHATWIDAGGERTEVPARWDGRDIVMAVPSDVVDASAFPAVLDPIIGPENGVDSAITGTASGGQYQPQVAYGGSTYFVVWNDYRASSFGQIFATRVSSAGAVLDPMGILVNEPGIYAYNPSVVWDGTNFMVVYERSGDIVGRRFSTMGSIVDVIPFIVTSNTYYQWSPFAYNNGTQTFVAWADERNYATTGTDIYGVRLMGTTPTGGEILITNATSSQYYARVTYGGGNWFIVWQDYRDGFSDPDVFGGRVSSAGVALDSTGIAISAASGQQYNPWVASNGTDYFVVWQDDRNVNYDIYGARITSGGVLSDPSGIQVVNHSSYQYSPSVAYNGGNYQVVWVENRGPGLWGGRVSSAGTLLDGPAGMQISAAVPNYPSEPRVFATGTDFYVAWNQYVGEGGNGDIVGSRMTTTPALLDGGGVNLAQTGNGQTQVDLASDGTSRWFVVWNDDRGGNRAIYGARIDSTGASLDPSGILLSSGGLYEQQPAVAYNGTHFLVVWSDSRSPSWGLWGTRVNPSTGAVVDGSGLGLFLNSLGNQPYDPEIASDGSGWFVSWMDYRSGHAEIYGGRVSSSGSSLDPAGIPVSTGGATEYKYSPNVAYGGGYYLVLWVDYRSMTSYDLYGARVAASTGVVQEPAGIGIATSSSWVNSGEYAAAYVSPEFMIVYSENAQIQRVRLASATGTLAGAGALTMCCNYNPAIAFDSDVYVVAYTTSASLGYNVRGTRMLPDGTDLDAIDWDVVTAGGVTYEGPDVAAITDKGLIAYSRYDSTPGVTSDRIRTRTVSRLANGGACTGAYDCASGFCVDGVCCDSACGGGASGCQTCSTGTCGPAAAGTVCRAAASVCDAAETCTGASTTCPADVFAASGTVCRAASGVCDVAETCDGMSGSCPTNGFADTTVECRASTGVCDVAENCNGLSASCPGNGFAPASTVCRAASGACDLAETCTGIGATCPTDIHAGSTVVCRPASGGCDVEETCNGSDPNCPPNVFASSGTVCRPAVDLCDNEETCSGTTANCPNDALSISGTVCRTSTDDCDPAEACSGMSALCPPDSIDPDGTTCSDGMACTVGDVCEGGVCQPGAPDPECTEPPDAGPDAAPADAGPDADPGQEGEATPLDCDCRVGGKGGGSSSWIAMLLVAIWLVRRRR